MKYSTPSKLSFNCKLVVFFFLIVTSFNWLSAQSFVHPGLSHKKSDLDRMKMMVAAGKEPWKSSFASLSLNQYASYNYVVKGSSSNTVINETISSEYNKIKFDGLAAYYNSLMWYITGDERHAQKAVEIFNAWVNVKRFVSDGTDALNAGRVVWKLLEAAEIIKTTYPGWQQADIDKFKAMLVYPGYSTTTVPTAAINSSDVTFYWYMYNGDPGRHGNQGIFAMRGIMAMGIFMDNRTMYDRALRYLTAQPHRPDDLPYVSGPPIVSTTKASTSNQYFDVYTQVAPFQQTTSPDYGYDDQIQYYIDENGQGEEASRDQSHSITGVSILNTIAEMAWNQGDNMYSYLDNRILLGLEYALRYNASYHYSFPDQTSPWEPTVENGQFTSRRDRSGRWTSLKINPFTESDFTRLTRGEEFKSNRNPFHEMVLAHYRDRIGLSADKYKWTQRAFDISLNEFGYEGQGFEVDNPGYGGLTFRRTNLSPGDPVQSFVNGQPVYAMNTLPATIEAENYDYFNGGGQGKTYFDADNGNSAGAYRTAEGVDIAVCSEGGYAVINMQPGEWINYTVAVPKTGFYKIAIRYSSLNANGKIRFDFDGVNATGDVAVPFGGGNSTGADDWKDFVVATVPLQAGVQSMRIYVAGTESALNLNNIIVAAVNPSDVPAAPLSLAVKAGRGQASLSWNASVGATSYKVKRATTSGGPYITIATVDATVYTNTGLTNGTTYYYVISAVNTLGEGTNSTEATATPTDAGSLVEDNFETGLGSPVTGRTPEVSIIGNRVFQPSFTGTSTFNTITGGDAQLTTLMAEVVDVSNTDGYTKPTYINISGSFNEGTLINNTPARPARGVYFGFWSSLLTGTVGFQNMRGVFVNPEDGELHLWNGSSSTTSTPVQSLSYQGTWNASAEHTISYTINTVTGSISEFVLDGVTYLWNKTNIFTDANTNYAGFGTSGSASGQYGNIGNFKVKDNKVWNEVVRSPQTITFPELSDKKIGNVDFNTGASASSGLPLTYVNSTSSIATVAADGTVRILGVGKDTITAYQSGNGSYGTATSVSRVLTITKDGSAALRLLVQDNFTTGDSVTNRKPDVATIFGRGYQKAKSVSTAKNLIANGAAQLYDNMGEAIKIADTSSYTKPVYINISDTFDLGTLTNNSPARPARGVFLGFWKAIPTSTSTSIDAYSQFYGVFVNPDGTLRLWNGKNKSDSTPVQTLSYIGTWSGGVTKHTMSYTINTSTGIMSNFVLDGVTTYAWKDTAIFTAANVNYAGFGVSGAASTNNGNIQGFKVTNASPMLSQTITFPDSAVEQIGDVDFNPQASASSGNLIAYSSSNTAVATIVNGLIHIVGEGTATITATQSGNSDYLPASATQTLTVKRSQTIAFNSFNDKYVGDADFNLTATASSGLPITYISSDSAVATIVNGNQLHLVGRGNTTITASQAGDASYAAATSQTQLQVVKKINQTITFNALPARQVGDADFDPAATATSGLPVSYTSGDEMVATIVNGKIHVVGEGTILITALQGGDSRFNVAASVTQALNVIKKEQTITFNALSQKQVGEADFSPAATASSGLAVTYTSSNESVATIVNGIVHIAGVGTTKITASQSGNNQYGAATSVTQTLTVNKQYYVDSDKDGFGSNTIALLPVNEAPEGYSTNNTDCNDNDATVHEPKQYYVDADKDGYGSPETAMLCTSVAPQGYSTNNTDCNDNDAIVHEPREYYVDKDKDGFGSTETAMLCTSVAPQGYSTNNTDCNDNDATAHEPKQYYVDADKDGYGSPETAMLCTSVAPQGYSTNNTDCNDNDATIHEPQRYYLDADKDGYGSTTAVMLCLSVAPFGYSINNADCDDTRLLYADKDGDGLGAGLPVACGVSNNSDCDDTNPIQLVATIPDVYALNATIDEKNTIYKGYGPTSLAVKAVAMGGTPPYSYLWNSGLTTQTITVASPGNYSVTITDAKGCKSSATVTIKTIDVTCGNSGEKVMICHNGVAICVNSNAVQDHLNHGDALGSCINNASRSTVATQFVVPEIVTLAGSLNAYPNPSNGQFKVQLNSIQQGKARIIIRDVSGKQVAERSLLISLNSQTEVFNLRNQPSGFYHLQIITNEGVKSTKILINR
jgi:hypothetical protein